MIFSPLNRGQTQVFPERKCEKGNDKPKSSCTNLKSQQASDSDQKLSSWLKNFLFVLHQSNTNVEQTLSYF